MDEKIRKHEYYLKHRSEHLLRGKKYAEEHRIELKQYKHDYYLKHRNRLLKEAAKWHKEHPEQTKQATYRWQHKNPDKLRNSSRLYYRRHRDERLEHDKIKRQREPEKAHAHDVARYIPLAPVCELCNSTERLERHHPDYSEPYIFVTLCKDCHEAQTLFDAGITNSSENL